MINGHQLMNTDPESAPAKKLPYEKPAFLRVELAIDETLSSGCKLGTDSTCVGPPITAYDGGS